MEPSDIRRPDPRNYDEYDHEHTRSWDPDEPLPKKLSKVEGVKWLWAHMYYDGPISGMVSVPGEPDPMWADMIDEYCGDNCPFYRRYKIVRVSKEALTEERERHALFTKHVGTYFDYTIPRGQWKTHPQAEWDHYWDVYPVKDADKWGTRTNGDVIGWFEE